MKIPESKQLSRDTACMRTLNSQQLRKTEGFVQKKKSIL